MYKLDESSKEEYEVNLFDLPTEQEAFEAALAGNPITIPTDWNEEEIFYLIEESKKNENYQTTEDFYFMNNSWSDVEYLNRTEILLTTNPNIEKESKMHKGVQTAQDLEIVKQTLHKNYLLPFLIV
ncbi:15446_t:CDS:1 [Cetraspora pellucida]|uniref:15446_t:CDS:1 n=1 Tax=Cetraspora pellucida TaxID=1433469 RepID=A0ACA9N122_9GLOM|nr:15446_t:CDS:1 [Cetraspora pellucida]